MTEAADFFQAIQLTRFFLKTTDKQHLVMHAVQYVGAVRAAFIRQARGLLGSGFRLCGHETPKGIETRQSSEGCRRLKLAATDSLFQYEMRLKMR